MKKTLLILICLPLIGFGQNLIQQSNNQNKTMQQLKNIKELFDMGLIDKIEYDSLSIQLKTKILNEINKKDDGFYYKDKIMYPEQFYTTQKRNIISRTINTVIPLETRSKVEGIRSSNIIDGDFQKFKLILSTNTDLAGNSLSNISYQQAFSIAKSPKDFVLINLSIDTTKGYRWISTAQYNLIFGGDKTININQYIDFTWQEIKQNEFEINTKLVNGEYAFVFLGTKHGESNRLFTFSIQNSSINDEERGSKPIRSNYNSTFEFNNALKKWNRKQ